MKDASVKIKIIAVDHYLSFEHGLYSGTECDAIPQYTSTKKLKSYIVKSKKNGNDIYLSVEEVELKT